MKINKEIIIQFFKFSIVGFINAVLSYIITNVGYYTFNLHEQIANILAFVITVFISFYLNRKFVFEDENNKGKYFKALIKVYMSYSITGLFLTAILLYLEEQILGIPHYIATLLNIVISVPINFVLNKFL